MLRLTMSHVRVPPSWSACLIGCVDRTRRSLVWTLMEIRRGDLFPILDLKKDIIGLVCPILWAWIREKTGRVLNLGRGRVMNIACHCLLQDGKQTLHHSVMNLNMWRAAGNVVAQGLI